MDRTGPQVHVAPVKCPFCHEGIPRGETPAVCGDCHALHHVACMSEHGACAACGRESSPAPAPRPSAPITLPRASPRWSTGVLVSLGVAWLLFTAGWVMGDLLIAGFGLAAALVIAFRSRRRKAG